MWPVRRDPSRAAVLLWGMWLGVLGVVFSDGTYLNSYYVAALSPATAALCGIGAASCWRRRGSPVARVLLACALLACTSYGIYLLLGATAVPRWLITSALAVGLAGAVATLTSPRLRGEAPAARPVAAAVFACALLLPTVTSVEAVARNVGPFTAPFEPGATLVGRISVAQLQSAAQSRVSRISSTYHTPIAFATDTSSTAATYVYYTGREILPIGGYRGGIPSPTLTRLQQYIASGDPHAFLIPIEPPSEDPRLVVGAHPLQASPTATPTQRRPTRHLRLLTKRKTSNGPAGIPALGPDAVNEEAERAERQGRGLAAARRCGCCVKGAVRGVVIAAPRVGGSRWVGARVACWPAGAF